MASDAVHAAHVALVREAVEKHFANQGPEEFSPLLDLIADDPPRAVLEIGSQYGGTLWLLARVAAPDAVLLSVDVGTNYACMETPEAVQTQQQRAHFLLGNSHDPLTLRHVEDCLEGRPVDLLLIDGDHTYDGVRKDWETYSPLVRNGGWVALHDIFHSAIGLDYGVHRFWPEIKASRPGCYEFSEPGCAGLGVVQISL